MSELDELNRRLDEHSKELMTRSDEYRTQALKVVEARNAYDLARAKAMLRTASEHQGDKSWTVDRIKAEALVLCEPQMTEARIAEAHLDAIKTRLSAVSDSLSAVQTQARLLKTEAAVNNYRP